MNQTVITNSQLRINYMKGLLYYVDLYNEYELNFKSLAVVHHESRKIICTKE